MFDALFAMSATTFYMLAFQVSHCHSHLDVLVNWFSLGVNSSSDEVVK